MDLYIGQRYEDDRLIAAIIRHPEHIFILVKWGEWNENSEWIELNCYGKHNGID